MPFYPNTEGRFNYLTVRQDVYEVIFKPMRLGISLTIASNLDRETALDLMSALNEVIDEARKEFSS